MSGKHAPSKDREEREREEISGGGELLRLGKQIVERRPAFRTHDTRGADWASIHTG